MEYSHWYTKVTLGKDSKMLKSRIQNGFTIRAIEYEWDLNLDLNWAISFGLKDLTKNQFLILKQIRFYA